MTVPLEQVQKLRAATGAGVVDCQQALTESGGDFDAAIALLRKRGLQAVGKRSDRTASAGRVEAYLHGDGRIGTLVVLACETDFVARTEEFRTLAKNLAMQVAATAPQWVAPADVPADVVERERSVIAESEDVKGKRAAVVERIVTGRLEKFFTQHCLLEQPYIRDEDQTVGALVASVSAKLGEKLAVTAFQRFSV